MKELTLNPLPYQSPALWDINTSIMGISAGKGSGKSFIIAVCKAIYLSSIHRGYEGLVASPTLGMTRRNLIPMFKRMNEQFGLNIKELKNSNSPSSLSIDWGGKTSIIHLSVSIENHERLNGMNLAWLIADECDIARRENMKNFAEEAVFRCRYPAPGHKAQIIFMGAPELNGFMGEYFLEHPSPRKKLYRWSMENNYMLSPDYKAQILELIPESKRAGWVHGEFMYNSDGLVYDEYDPILNHTDLTINDLHDIEKIHVMWDINDGGCNAYMAVNRGKFTFIIDEWAKLSSTDAVIEKVNKQPWAHRAILTCDPACTQVFPYIEKSNLKHQIMKSAPPIEWRVTALNVGFGTEAEYSPNVKKRKLLINTKKCKVLNKCLMRQGYIKGVPDKKTWIEEAGTDISGPLDGVGYFYYRDHPFQPQGMTRAINMRGF